MQENKKTLAGCVIFLMGLAMIGMGTCRLEPLTVLTKAINICMECIGIG